MFTNKYAGIAICMSSQVTETKSLLTKKTKNNSQHTSDAPTLVHRIEQRTDVNMFAIPLLPFLSKIFTLHLVLFPSVALASCATEMNRLAPIALE